MARVRLSLSHREDEDSPSCLLRLLLALSSSCIALFIRWAVFVFSFFGKFLFLLLLLLLLDRCSSCRHRLLTGRLNLDSDGPDEAQQFAPHCGDDLALVLACRRQPGIALGEPDLRFPGNLLDWFWNPFLSLAQPWPDRRDRKSTRLNSSHLGISY